MNKRKTFYISKVLNNNVILALECDTNHEMILIGKGIGFGKKEKGKIQLSDLDIQKSYIAYDESTKNDFLKLINQLNGNVIGITEEIIAMAEKRLGKLNSHIHIALTDHIGFALDRINMGMEINNPFLYEIKALYSEEYQVGLLAAELIKKSLGIEISDTEVGFIALHFHSARQNKKVLETVKNTRLLMEIVEIICEELSITISNKDLTYARLINHLRAMINRLEEKKYIENPLLNNIKEKFDTSFKIAKRIGSYIKDNKDISISEDELGYMTVHIERLRKLHIG